MYLYYVHSTHNIVRVDTPSRNPFVEEAQRADAFDIIAIESRAQGRRLKLKSIPRPSLVSLLSHFHVVSRPNMHQTLSVSETPPETETQDIV